MTCTEVEGREDARAAQATTRRIRRAQRQCMEIIRSIGTLEGTVLALRQSENFNAEEVEEVEGRLDILWMDIYGLISDTLASDYTAEDVASWYMRAVDLGAKHPRVGRSLIEQLARLEKVALAPLRKRYEAIRHDEEEQARVERARETVKDPSRPGRKFEAGSTDNTINGKLAAALAIDRRDIPRYMGVKPYRSQGENRMHIFTSYERAVTMARVLGLSPHQAGV